MSLHERSARSLLALQLLASPVAGGAGAVLLFAALVRPGLSWDPWLADAVAVVCGAVGILLGGALGSTVPSRPRTGSSAARRSRTLVPGAGAVALLVILTGSPATWAMGAGLLGLSGAMWLAASAGRRRTEGGHESMNG